MSDNAPFEVVSAPGSVYFAPVGTAFPDLDDDPTATFTLLGTSGDKSITEAGITVRHRQTVETDAFRMLGTTGPVKAVRTAEDLEIEFTLADLSAIEYAQALDSGLAVTDTAPASGVPGNLNFPLIRGLAVAQQAILVQFDVSPEASAPSDDFKMQYEIPRAVQVGEPEVVYTKGAPAGLRFVFRAIEDPTDGFGQIRLQDEVAI